MTKEQISKILNQGDTIKWNKYRQVHPEWVPDLRGIELKSPDSDLDRGADAAFTEPLNLKGSLYDFTTEFPFDFNPAEYGMVLKEGEETIEAISQEKAKSKTDAPDIFISHSSQDLEFVKALVDLIEATLKDKPRIRCTSLPGYKLKTGAYTDERLRQEIKTSRLLIGVITPSSMKSAYVLFELGARWVIDDKNSMFPIMACGANSSILKVPLKLINAIGCYESADIHQIIDDIATKLKIEKANAASYQGKIERLVELSKKNKIKSVNDKVGKTKSATTEGGLIVNIDAAKKSITWTSNWSVGQKRDMIERIGESIKPFAGFEIRMLSVTNQHNKTIYIDKIEMLLESRSSELCRIEGYSSAISLDSGEKKLLACYFLFQIEEIPDEANITVKILDTMGNSHSSPLTLVNIIKV